MANVDDRNLAVGRLYAEAMLGLAEERGQADALLDELVELVQFLDQNPQVEHFLASPLVEEDARARVIEGLFQGKASDLLVDSLQVINRKGRLTQIRAVAEAYRTALRDLRGYVDVAVRTAVPLNDALRSRLMDAMTSLTGKKPTLHERIDPALLGGMVVEVAGKKIDASVASRLHGLSEALAARASREILSGGVYAAES
jgi:F-type H+-transporting ATPase subunit delta